MTEVRSFKLSSSFLEEYEGKQPEWGPVGYITFKRTYSRRKEDGTNEEFWETCKRVVEGCYNVQKRHCHGLGLVWDNVKSQKSAQEMFHRMWEFKWLPPGRGLWMMGTPYIERVGGAALNNCGFVSTEGIAVDLADPFCWMMDMLMLGVGVGFDAKGAGLVKIQEPKKGDEVFVVEDSREGWVSLLRRCITPYSGRGSLPGRIDYSLVRPAGSPINGFGGTASGYGPLDELVKSVQELLDGLIGQEITTSAIVDICNLIGRCVVAGNVRRSAEIAFGDPEDEEFLNLKNPEVNKEALYNHRWASNNSIFATVGMDYSKVAAMTAKNGEPGYEWLENAQAFGRMGRKPDYRDRRARGGNPCLEQTLEDRELCCVSGGTRILTRDGYPRIEEVVGKEVDVWNGKNWSTVTPFLAAKNKKLYRVTLSDGSFLDVTDNHGWSAKEPTQRVFRKIDTVDLKEGMILERCELVRTESGFRFENAYQAGWVCGDGFIDGNKVMALVQEPEYSIVPHLGGVVYKEQHLPGYARPFKRVNLSGVISLDLGKALRDSDTGLPEEMFSWDAQSISEFMAGWIDTDGTVRRQQNTDNYVLCSTSEKKLRDAQILLRKIGVNYSTLHKWNDEGHETNYGVRNKALWTLYIPSFEAMHIEPKLKPALRFGSRYKTNNAHPDGNKIDRAKRQKIVSVEELDGKHDTFCFSEPHEHKGVFGNCLTYQCLVETFPSRHENYEDYEKTLKYAYLYAKSVTLINTHDMRTNQVLLRNRRIGASMSGIIQAMQRHGRREFYNWCDKGYNYLRELDKIYADWLCVRESIKITSTKPSGTVSLLPGVTPGIHYPHSEYYIRRIRFQSNHSLVDRLKKHGYHVEQDEYSPNTVCVEFPVKEEFFDRSKTNVSMWEQLEIAAQVQQYWADNQVSITVTFKPEEAGDIKHALELYETRLKGVSFLPITDHGYVQAPYESITQEEYDKRVKKIRPILTNGDIEHDQVEKFCDSEVCMI